RDQAIPLLLRALKHADGELKREILFVLGSFAKEQSIGPLYEIMTDREEDEEIRQDAAIQISVIAPLLQNPQPVIDSLLKDIGSADAELRLHATFALGWQGNFQAAIPLIERLYDDDDRVRQTAVNALCNLRDDRILPLLLERLEHGDSEQKHCILDVYLKCLEHDDPDVRFDALACLGLLVEARDHLEVYRKLLKDPDPRIRGLAVKRLAEDAAEAARQSFPADIEALLEDPDMKVKRAALKILKKSE
ncbi:MAG: lyase domain protein repeat-containing protein, partial [Deltaproteobacteria bacterium]|nr:lyase domain protein repeat-containing protein [Deltaproteobacteria bacterium]